MPLQRGYTFGATEQVTNDKLHQLVDEGTVGPGTITMAMLVDQILTADAAGRAKMQNGYVNTPKLEDGVLTADLTGRAKMADQYVTLAKLIDGILSADEAGRKRMADGFLSADAEGRAKMADEYVTQEKLAPEVVQLTTIPVATVMTFARQTAPAGWLKADGSAVVRSEYPALDDAIYVGGEDNATAVFGYRTTSQENPDANRDVNGQYIVLPDLRGEFPRGWDDGRGADDARQWASEQADAFQGHRHQMRNRTGSNTSQSPTMRHSATGSDSGAHTDFDGLNGAQQPVTDNVNGDPRVADETRPRNVTLLYCIKT